MNTVRWPKLPANSNTVVELTVAECQALREYSTTLPTGVTVGKWWKRNLNAMRRPKTADERIKPLWRACCYAPDPTSRDGKHVLIHYCPIRLIAEPPAQAPGYSESVRHALGRS